MYHPNYSSTFSDVKILYNWINSFLVLNTEPNIFPIFPAFQYSKLVIA